MDDEAAGRLSSMELYRITTAALEGHQMRQLAYRALIDNYNSLMGTSNHKDNAFIDLSTSPIFDLCTVQPFIRSRSQGKYYNAEGHEKSHSQVAPRRLRRKTH